MESIERRVERRECVRSTLHLGVSGLAMLLASVPVWAHDDAEELGHHWEVPGYLGEVRLQLVAMAVLTCVIIGSMYFARLRRKRGAHR